MPNRFTQILDDTTPEYTCGSYERIGWVDIPDELYYTVRNFNDFDAVLQIEFDERTLFLCLLAEMSDADLMECFGI